MSTHSRFSQSDSNFSYSVPLSNPLMCFFFFFSLIDFTFLIHRITSALSVFTSAAVACCGPSPRPFLLFGCQALLSLRHICRAVQLAFHPRAPHCISRNPLRFLSTFTSFLPKTSSCSSLGEMEEPIVPSFLTASWVCPLGEVALGVELTGETKGRKEGKKQELFPMRS